LAYYKQGKIREAREMFEMALKKNPDNAGAKEMLNSLEGRCPPGVRP
jgi:TolA-binding protein